MRTRVKRLRDFQQLASAKTRSIVIDQGTDKGGEDIGFRPTELWMFGLSSCSATTMTRYAKQKNYPLAGIEVHAEDQTDEQGYIKSITFQVVMEGELTQEQKADLLKHTKANCKLLRTIHSDIEVSYKEVQIAAENKVTCSLEDGSCCI